jgi:hypothetical protein
LESSHDSCLLSVQCDTAGGRQLLKPSFARLGRRGVCPYAKLEFFAPLAAVLCELCGYKLLLVLEALSKNKAFNRQDRKGNAKLAKKFVVHESCSGIV